MARNKGRSTNTYDDVNAPLGIALNTSTYTTLLTANEDRIGYKITNDTPHDILVKEQGAGDPDSADRGFEVFKRAMYESTTDNIAVGEISAKALTGSPIVLVVEV